MILSRKTVYIVAATMLFSMFIYSQNSASAAIPGIIEPKDLIVVVLPPEIVGLIDLFSCDLNIFIYGCDSSGNPLPEPTVDGECGSASDVSHLALTSTSANLCSKGNVDNFSGGSGTNPWTWNCDGTGPDATNDSCNADKICTYDDRTCTPDSFDCSLPTNCGKTKTLTPTCTGINSCTGDSYDMNRSDCSSCNTSVVTCLPCPLTPGTWREVAP